MYSSGKIAMDLYRDFLLYDGGNGALDTVGSKSELFGGVSFRP
jgi:hypothetical protein